MTTFYHGTDARFYYDKMDMSPYAEQVAAAFSRDVKEYRPLSPANVIRVAGLRDVNIALTGGAMDTEVGGGEEQAWNLFNLGTQGAFAFLPYGDVLGRFGYCGQALTNTQSRVVGDDIVRLPLATVGTNQTDRSVILRALAAGGASPGTTVNSGADSHNGGAGYLICTANTGALDVAIEESADGNVPWVAICTFTQRTGGTATGSEVKEVAVGATVKQYLRATWTISAAATFFVAFGRR